MAGKSVLPSGRAGIMIMVDANCMPKFEGKRKLKSPSKIVLAFSVLIR